MYQPRLLLFAKVLFVSLIMFALGFIILTAGPMVISHNFPYHPSMIEDCAIAGVTLVGLAILAIGVNLLAGITYVHIF